MFKAIASLLIVYAFISGCGQTKETKISTGMKPVSNTKGVSSELEIATLGGGCFWCIETIFDDLKGVDKVVSGYSGGHTDNPDYKQVCRGESGHAEVVQITFDPNVISFEKLLEVFFHIHNPTTLNKQGADVGDQYRSVIFYHDETQKSIADKVKKQTGESGLWSDPIVTEITAFEKFYPAEDYHQDYYENNPDNSYCSFVIAPKVQKFYKEYKDYLKEGVAN